MLTIGGDVIQSEKKKSNQRVIKSSAYSYNFNSIHASPSPYMRNLPNTINNFNNEDVLKSKENRVRYLENEVQRYESLKTNKQIINFNAKTKIEYKMNLKNLYHKTLENHLNDVEEFKKKNLSVKKEQRFKQHQDINKNQEYKQIKTACIIEKKNILRTVKEEISKNILVGKKQLKEQIIKQDHIGKQAFHYMKINPEIKEAVNNKLTLIHETIISSKNSSKNITKRIDVIKSGNTEKKIKENQIKENSNANNTNNITNKKKLKNQTISLPIKKNNKEKINLINDEKLLEFYEKKEEELLNKLKDLKFSYKCE